MNIFTASSLTFSKYIPYCQDIESVFPDSYGKLTFHKNYFVLTFVVDVHLEYTFLPFLSSL